MQFRTSVDALERKKWIRTFMTTRLLRRPSSTTLLDRLIETPDLVQTVRGLPKQAFSALVRQVGVEDAGEIIALATTDQIVAAFDEDLFVNTRPGEREVFDSNRFAVWLEVLLEAGDDVAAKRVAELSEDFAIQAISSLVLVLDNDALTARMSEGDQSAIYADKALENTLSEEIDGYLLISRKYDGWDAALSLILALDRDHRPLLVRILDRCAAMASEYVEDLDALITVLSSEESLAEDVESEREERRGQLGFVEPRAARSFLELARKPMTTDIESEQRDPVTRAYFREIERRPPATVTANRGSNRLIALLNVTATGDSPLRALSSGVGESGASANESTAFVHAMRLLKEKQPERFNERMEELAYLANVLVAGAKLGNRRFRPSEAAEAAIATVALGAELEAQSRGLHKPDSALRASGEELCEVLGARTADLLFRMASRRLKTRGPAAAYTGYILTREEVGFVIEQLNRKRPPSSRKHTATNKPTS
jgi:hypothetical protein